MPFAKIARAGKRAVPPVCKENATNVLQMSRTSWLGSPATSKAKPSARNSVGIMTEAETGRCADCAARRRAISQFCAG